MEQDIKRLDDVTGVLFLVKKVLRTEIDLSNNELAIVSCFTNPGIVEIMQTTT